MLDSEYKFLLNDRIQKIQSIDDMYDLKNKSYVSFSGGKDSTVLSKLIDMALIDNVIPRLFVNTGIEYSLIVKFVKELQVNDNRINIITPSKNIKEMLNEVGYPFKSKEHSEKLNIYQTSGMCKTVSDYLEMGNKKSFLCPNKLKYQFTDKFNLKCSNKCCNELKKKPCEKWAKENNRLITITGIRQNEGGLRTSIKGCTIFKDNECKELKKFHPLFPLNNEFINEFIKREDVKLCELYYSPFNFKRTGCKGCPYNPKLQNDLNVMQQYLPKEKKQCEYIWKPVYDEYRRIGYRLDKDINVGLFKDMEI